nr:DUF805 domain-containing protein [Ligilactobacillus cholophilus]
MTYYCEKCGHKMDSNEEYCSFCGAKQMRFAKEYETKKCKKCDKDIYVNANFCPYCGTDQAILDLHKDLAENDEETDHDNQKNLTKEQRIQQSLLNADLTDKDSLEKFVKEMNDAGIKVRVLKPEEKNENVQPGLFVSTKLILKDMFKINKRMGINDYWWGVGGLFLLMTLLSTLIAYFATSVLHVTTIVGLLKSCSIVIVPLSIIFQIILFTATFRRLHDAKLPNWLMIFWVLGTVGQLALMFLCLMGPRLDDNPYTFNVKDYYNHKNKM